MFQFQTLAIFLLIGLTGGCVNCELNQSGFIRQQLGFFDLGVSSLLWNYLSEKPLENISVSEQCKFELHQIVVGNNTEYRKLSGRFPEQFLKESYADFGQFDSCLILNTNQQPSYCLVSLLPDYEKLNEQGIIKEKDFFLSVELSGIYGQSVKIGLCLPSSCSSSDVHWLVQQVIRDFHWTQDRKPHCTVNRSFIESVKRSTLGQKVTLAILALLMALVSYAGLMDVVYYFSKSCSRFGNSYSIHSFFSPVKSLKSIFAAVDGDRLIYLDQMRFSIYFLIFGLHIPIWPSSFNAFYLVSNYNYVREFSQYFYTQPLVNFQFLEFLFLLGGLSSVLQVWRKMQSESSLKVCLALILERFIRYQPLILTSIGLEMLLPLLGSGPAYSALTEERSQLCSNNYLYNVLHITNSLPSDQICGQHLWSMSAELHIFVLIVFVMYFYKRNRFIGQKLAILLLVAGFFYRLSIFSRDGLIPVNTITPIKLREMQRYWDEFYLQTVPRVWSSMWSVYLLMKIIETPNWHVPKLLTKWRTIWAFWLVHGYSTSLFNYWHLRPTGIVKVVYHIVFDLLFALSFSCIVLRHRKEMRRFCLGDESHNNNNNEAEKSIKNSTQASKIDILLRLSRNVYYLHASVLIWYYSTYRKPVEWWSNEAVRRCFFMFFLLYVLAPLFQVLVNSPYERLYASMKRRLVGKRTKLM